MQQFPRFDTLIYETERESACRHNQNERYEFMKPCAQNLVVQAKKGDTHAFATLYEQIYKDLYRFAFCTMKNATQAEDVVSAAVLHAFENIHKLRKASAFQSWMFQIVANECRRQFRLQAKIIPYDSDEVFESADSSAEDLAGHLALKQAFATLGETERLIVGLNLFAGYSSREIARYLHKKEGTVRSCKKRALDKMRRLLEDPAPDEQDKKGKKVD